MWLPRLLLALLCLLPTMALSQGAKYSDYTIDSNGRAVGGIQIRVCATSSPSSPPPVSPCSPLATLYTDQTLTLPASNPLTSDAVGNFSFYAPTGFYILQFYSGTTQVFSQTVQVGTTNTNTIFNATIGFQIGGSFGSNGQCITSTGTGSVWGSCGGGGGGGGISTLLPGSLTGPTITFTVNSSGSDFAVSGASNTITLSLPTASGTNRGALSSADWTTFNGKQGTISVTAPLTLSGASVGMVNQGTTTTLLHGNAAGNPSFSGVSLTADTLANQGTVNQVLHGNAAGQPSFGAVTSADTTGTFAPNAHNLLSATHGDTTAASVSVGDVITGQTGPKWARLAANATATKMYLQSVSSGAPSWQQIAYADVSGTPTLFYQTVQVAGASQTQQGKLNFTSGMSCVNNGGAGSTDCSVTTGGTGTVTSFSAGNLSPLFTTSVATATTTPALTFALSTAAAHTFYGNNTAGTATPGFQAIGLGDLPGTGALTVNTSAPLGGGGSVSLGGTLSLTCTGCLTSVTAHNLLSATHGDTTAGTVARADVITGQGASPTWTRLAKGTAGQCLQMDGTATDVVWGSCAAGGSVTSVTGTANQILASPTTGAVVVSITNPFIFPGKATFAATTTSNPSFNIPSGTAPTTPAAGDCWLASNVLNCVAQTGVSTAYLYYDTGGVNARTDDTTGTITAYTVHHPAAAPTINSQETTDTCTSAVCSESWSPVQQILRVTADFTTAANTNFQTPTGMTITLPANTALNMAYDCHWSYSQATAVSDSFGIQSATIAPTSIMGTATMGTSATAGTSGTLLALNTTTATAIVTATPTAATNLILDMHGMVENPSNASTNVINFMVKQTTAANVIVIKRGSWCKVF
jgi:hypothetical protein